MPTLRAHHDPDGLISAFFASYGIPNSIIELSTNVFGDTTGLTKEDWMLDMRPNDPSWNGTCIDHHFPHPKEHKYKLIPDIPEEYSQYANAIVPASLITFNYFKDKIPKNEWWKLCIGLGGDGQLELTPIEVFDSCPSLLKSASSSIYNKYGDWKISMMPIYKILSSAINSYLRREEYEQAISVVKYATSPLELYTSEEISIAKKEVNNEFTMVVKDSEMFEFDNLVIVVYESKYRMSGYVASALQNDLFRKTVMAINKRDGSLSLRGDLASYYKEKLKSLSYLEVDGHHAFMGGKLKKNYTKFISDLNEIVR